MGTLRDRGKEKRKKMMKNKTAVKIERTQTGLYLASEHEHSKFGKWISPVFEIYIFKVWKTMESLVCWHSSGCGVNADRFHVKDLLLSKKRYNKI